MLTQPVSNSLAGTIDPFTGQDACPITARGDGMVGMIPTAHTFEADGVTESPLEVRRSSPTSIPACTKWSRAERGPHRRGEEWLQTIPSTAPTAP